MNANEILMLYLQASEEVRNQINEILAEAESHPECQD